MNYKARVDRVAEWIAAEQLSAVLLVDLEGRRDPNIRYLTGQPGDALLFVLSDGRSILIPWDVNLAHRIATADEILPYTDFKRSLSVAVESLVKREKLTGRIEVSASTPYPVFEELNRVSGQCDVSCRSDGVDRLLSEQRMIKDADEVERIEHAAVITNELLDLLEDFLSRENDVSEVDVALLLEREALKRGAEGMSFESLVAGTSRSYGIHAFPTYTAADFGTHGMSILDFGVLVDGYPSDVTVTVLRGELNAKQREMVDLVEKAYDRAVAESRQGANTGRIAEVVDRLFEARGYSMPHSLGHGLGLQVHEKPILRNDPAVASTLEPGVVFTIEPGLYDPDAGGVRLENDLLITGDGTRVLTRSRFLTFR